MRAHRLDAAGQVQREDLSVSPVAIATGAQGAAADAAPLVQEHGHPARCQGIGEGLVMTRRHAQGGQPQQRQAGPVGHRGDQLPAMAVRGLDREQGAGVAHATGAAAKCPSTSTSPRPGR